GPGSDGVNKHCTCFCEPMIMPMPAEISQVSVPALARCGAWAEAEPETATTSAATPMRVRIMTEPPLLETPRDNARPFGRFLLGLNHVTDQRFKLLPWMRRRPRALLQVPAEALDAAAGLFQR